MTSVELTEAEQDTLEAARDEQARARLNGHGLVAAIHDLVCPKRHPHGSEADPCRFALQSAEGDTIVGAYDVAWAVRDYLLDVDTSAPGPPQRDEPSPGGMEGQ